VGAIEEKLRNARRGVVLDPEGITNESHPLRGGELARTIATTAADPMQEFAFGSEDSNVPLRRVQNVEPLPAIDQKGHNAFVEDFGLRRLHAAEAKDLYELMPRGRYRVGEPIRHTASLDGQSGREKDACNE
jgi:hypothetical protein